ncbi:transcription factor grauzone-like [Stomoxys calcitrans]|uniref:transcription factor grauzone-like n=1 Tax=Stomoxys calcitrans TaxID=35570 RepID=UPI0027E316C8|nr:transcription factor grauzone-like [Stomoxys calcitrans]
MLRYPPPSDHCRLCVKSCNDYQRSLYDETGQANANHNLVGKYVTNAMLNMEWEKRLQYICGKCWQHIWEFHQFQESIIKAQKGQHLNKQAAKEAGDIVKVKSEMNIKDEQLEWQNAQEISASIEDLTKPAALSYDIKTEEPLHLNSDYEDTMTPQGLEQLTDEEMSLVSHMSNRTDKESNEECMPSASLGQTNLKFSYKTFPAAKKSVEEFDQLVALWRSSLECEICHQLVVSYSQLKEHFSKNHALEGCYLMCCQLRLDSRYDIEQHVHYHNAPQQLKCEVCCKVYRLESYLKIHIRKFHTSKGGAKNANGNKKLEAKYRCSKCLKGFATKTRLNKHNCDVHKPKIFECNICEKSCSHPNALREHLASHTRNKTHACSICQETFTSRAYYRRHMRKYHLQEWNKIQNKTAQEETLDGYEESLAKRASRISETVQPKTTAVTNTTPAGDAFNMLGNEAKEEEKYSLMKKMEERELKDENSTGIYASTEEFSADANTLGIEMDEDDLPPVSEDATCKSEEFITSEEEFIEL